METEIIVKGIIYKITNLINGKIYIGKTKTHYGNKPHGIKARLTNHIAKAQSGDRGCPALYNAIVKHGKSQFVIEKLCKCDLTDVDYHETAQIQIHDSTNKKIGYNVALGGGGRSVVNVPETTRQRISKNAEHMNLTRVYRKDVHVGYTARRKDKGIQYQKWFTSTKNSVVENKKLAVKWLNDFRENGVIGQSDYNKRSKLPKNICEIKENDKCVGYKVRVVKNGNMSKKCFQNNKIPLTDLLNSANEYKNECLNSVKINE